MADDLIQLLLDENPYGYVDAAVDLTSSIGDIRAQFAELRGGKTAPNDLSALKNLSSIDGPSSKAKKDDPAKIAETYEQLMEGLFWQFKGKPIRVSKAMRLQYKVGGRTYYVLVGFEGSGDGM